jgi:L-histidine Nalpha-methyltransferase
MEATGETFHFRAWEVLHTENSCKYAWPQIEELARQSGFTIETSFLDPKHYFANVLFIVPPK